jgi:hypothetical protein
MTELASAPQPIANPLTAACLRLRALSYRRIAPQPHGGTGELLESAARLGRELGREALLCLGPATAHSAIDDYVVCSTILSGMLLDDSPHHHAFVGAIAANGPRAVDWLTHGYECASWGYVFREVLRKAMHTGARRLLLQIADIDIHCFNYWLGNPQWGASGFGICTLVLDIEPGATWPLHLGAATPAHALVMMGRALNAFSSERPAVPVAPPFFKEASRRTLLKCIGDAPVHPDGHAQFGHSFGSDPWISLLLHRQVCEDKRYSGHPEHSRAVVNSLALNGYFSIAEIAYDLDTRFRLEAA